MFKRLSFSLAITSCVALSASLIQQKADEEKKRFSKPDHLFLCPDAPRTQRVTVRHIEANGIGYNTGYTTAELFLTPIDLWKNNYIPFLDLRAHLFNDNKWAGNAGIGIRFLSTNRIWGINGYYDYRKTKHQHYNQVSVGFESLGYVWDFRINGYLPVGGKSSPFYDTQFAGFQGNSILLSAKREFAMKGANAEAGIHCNPNSRNFPVYFTFGPYYLEGKGKVAWGGQARLRMNFSDYLTLEANTSYDSVFKWIGQGQAGINIPFGGRRRVKQRKNHTCKDEVILARRLQQNVDRFEIIPVKKQRKQAVAMDPGGLDPLFVYFVDNTSHSNGTFESPFNTLSAAQNASGPNDIIIVFPGDGTSTGMNQGVVLQYGQKIFGAHLSHTLQTAQGTIVMPPLAASAPILTNTNNFAMVVIASGNNEIAGLNIQSTVSSLSGGIHVLGPNAYIHNNVITTGNLNNGIAIDAGDCGTTLISNNSIYGSDVSQTSGIYLDSSAGQVTINNNLFSGTTVASGLNIGVNILPGAFTSLAGTLNLMLDNNTFNSQTNTTGSGSAISIENSLAAMQVNGTIENNIMNLPAGITGALGGLYVIEQAGAGVMTLNVLNNVATTVGGVPGYSFTNSASASDLILQFQNNVGTRVGP